jgi:hypothetical protein
MIDEIGLNEGWGLNWLIRCEGMEEFEIWDICSFFNKVLIYLGCNEMSLVRGAVNKWVFNRWGKMVEGAIK